MVAGGSTLLSRVHVRTSSAQVYVAHWGRETKDSTYPSDRWQAGHVLPGARANKVTLTAAQGNAVVCLFSRLVVSDSVTPWIARDCD